MASLFSIIGQYKGKLSMLPMMILLFVALTFVLYVVFHAHKWVKYLPAAAGIALGIVFFFRGFALKAHISGLELMWKSISFFVAGCIALATAWLVRLIESFSEPPAQKKEAPKKEGRKKEPYTK